MLDLKIDRLRLIIAGAAGQEHRLGPVAARAVALLADRLNGKDDPHEHYPNEGKTDTLTVPSVAIDWHTMDDEQAAGRLAEALLAALALKLGT